MPQAMLSEPMPGENIRKGWLQPWLPKYLTRTRKRSGNKCNPGWMRWRSLARCDDRQAILLRFYEQKSMADVGAALNVSEAAAKKRVAKALDKLRKKLQHKGVRMPLAGLGIAMAVGTTQSAPVTVVAACAQ